MFVSEKYASLVESEFSLLAEDQESVSLKVVAIVPEIVAFVEFSVVERGPKSFLHHLLYLFSIG